MIMRDEDPRTPVAPVGEVGQIPGRRRRRACGNRVSNRPARSVELVET